MRKSKFNTWKNFFEIDYHKMSYEQLMIKYNISRSSVGRWADDLRLEKKGGGRPKN